MRNKKVKECFQKELKQSVLCLKPTVSGRDSEEHVATAGFPTLPLFINNLAGKEPLRMLLPLENSTVHNNNTKKPW